MVSQDWLEEARKYGRLSQEERNEYWQRLTPDQQRALTTALSVPSQSPSPTPSRRGCSNPVVSGCVGLMAGVVLTLGVEIALLLVGVQAVSDTFQSLSGSSGGRSTPAGTPNLDNLSAQELVAYCGTEWEKKYQRIANVCAEQREVDRINEKVYRERTAQ